MTQYETAVEMDIGSLQRRVASLERQYLEMKGKVEMLDHILTAPRTMVGDKVVIENKPKYPNTNVQYDARVVPSQ
jgi:hypothetical protein